MLHSKYTVSDNNSFTIIDKSKSQNKSPVVNSIHNLVIKITNFQDVIQDKININISISFSLEKLLKKWTVTKTLTG